MTTRKRHISPTAGFTLIEMMVVVAIVAVLAAIAYPGYNDYVVRARRADARAVILEAAQFMERYYTENNSYAAATLPAQLQRAPKDGNQQFYTLTIANQSASTYRIEAAPQGVMANDPCGTLTLTQTGEKGANQPVGSTISDNDCWNR